MLRPVNLEELTKGGIRQEAILNFVNLQELARGTMPGRSAAQQPVCPAVQLPESPAVPAQLAMLKSVNIEILAKGGIRQEAISTS